MTRGTTVWNRFRKNTVELRLNSGGMKESKTKVTNLQFAVSSQFE
jgi:hypothetical protein